MAQPSDDERGRRIPDSFYRRYLVIGILVSLALLIISVLIKRYVGETVVVIVEVIYIISFVSIPCVLFMIDACHEEPQIERNAQAVRAPQPQGMVRTSSTVNETRIQVPNNSKAVTHKSSSTSTSGGVTVNVNVVVTTNVTVPRRTEPELKPKLLEPKPDPRLPCGRSVGIAMVATKALPPVISTEGIGRY
ncbi:hypothetical protein PIB30_066883 [Stylosanthes scabra]|uniref:Uncharacterized protein n=1 Tax=Stylosanthes scabra TaxID=79078 RepID=A0ABU6SMG7_9FABA|nr:hypothetical protein [Stylosanthes scabra]